MDPTKTRSPFAFPACFQKYLAETVGDGSEVVHLSLDRLCSCTQRWRRAQAESEGTKTRNQAAVWARSIVLPKRAPPRAGACEAGRRSPWRKTTPAGFLRLPLQTLRPPDTSRQCKASQGLVFPPAKAGLLVGGGKARQ